MGPAQKNFAISVTINDSVLFHWTIVSVDIADERRAIKVFHEGNDKAVDIILCQ